jgi:hypothetical protein
MQPGDTAPNLTFLTADGEPIHLSSFLTSDYLHLLFLRHLA